MIQLPSEDNPEISIGSRAPYFYFPTVSFPLQRIYPCLFLGGPAYDCTPDSTHREVRAQLDSPAEQREGMESRSDRPYRGCRLPRLPGYKVAGTFPFRRSLMTLFDKFYVLCALAACSILVSFWLLVSHRYRYSRVSYDTQPIGGLQTATEFDRRLVVFGDSWSDLNSGEVRVWTDLLCDSVWTINSFVYYELTDISIIGWL